MKKLLLLSLALTVSFAITLSELSQKIDAKVVAVGSTVSELEMTIIQKSGQKLVRDMRLKYLSDERQPKVLIEFLSPKDVQGTKLLTYINSEKDNDQWLYLPALKRVKRIVGKNKKGSFMGSEFSYEDFGKQDGSMFKYEENVNEETLEGESVYQGVRYPKDKASAYSRQIIYASKESYLLRKVEYYDQRDRLLKVATFSDYKEHEGVFRVGKIMMRNVQTHNATQIIWKKDSINATLLEKEFSTRALTL